MKQFYTQSAIKIFFLILLMQFCRQQAVCQSGHLECGFNPQPEEILAIERLNDEIQAFKSMFLSAHKPENMNPIEMPVQMHIFRKNDGTGGADSMQMMQVLDTLNKYFAFIDVHFFLCGNIHYIDNTQKLEFTNINVFDFPPIQTLYNKPNTINIYFSNKLDNGTSTPSGSAGFPNSENDAIFIDNDVINSTVIVHEMGHYFGLYHTFGKTNSCYSNPGVIPTPWGGELVNGSNCAFAGDNICDTPASPCGKTDSLCYYIGTVKDANNQPYTPDVTNLMEYSPNKCRTHFTPEQYARMLFFVKKYHSDKFCSPISSSYCSSRGQYTTDAWIQKFGLGSTVNISGNNNGFGNFTSDTIKLKMGELYPLELEAGYSCGIHPVYWRVFIDFNHDNDFFDAGEIFYDGISENGVFSIPFYCPRDILPGPTRVRVSMRFVEKHHHDISVDGNNYGSSMPPMPCAVLVNGEVEDYTVIIEPNTEVNPYCKPAKGNPNLLPHTITIGTFSFKYLNTSGYLFHKADTIELVRGWSYSRSSGPSGSTGCFIDYNKNNQFEYSAGEYHGNSVPFLIKLNAPLGVTRLRFGSGPNEAGCEYGMDFIVRIVNNPTASFPLSNQYFESTVKEWTEAAYIDSVLLVSGLIGVQSNFASEITTDLGAEDKHVVGAYKKTAGSDILGTYCPGISIDLNGNDHWDSDDYAIGTGIFERPFNLLNEPNILYGIAHFGTSYPGMYYNFNIKPGCDFDVSTNNYWYGRVDSVVLNNVVISNISGPTSNSYNLPSAGNLDFKLITNVDTVPHKWYIWLDINGDGFFDGPDETLFISDIVSGDITVSIQPPPNLQNGPRKLRIRRIYQNDPEVNNTDPCAKFAFGDLLEPVIFINHFNLIGALTYLPDNAGKFPLQIPVANNWEINGSSSWVSFSKTQGTGVDLSQMLYQKNNSFTARNSEFTLSSGSILKKIKITQLGSPITGIADTIYLNQAGGQFAYPVNIEAGATPLQFFDTDWWLNASFSGSSLTINCLSNNNIERVGRIVIRTKTGRAKTIVVVQEGLQIPFLEYSIDTFYLPGYQGGDTLAASIYANDDYTLKNLSPGWLWSLIGLKEDSLTTSTEPCSDHLYFRYADNIGDPPRQTLIEATTNSGVKKILTVIQDGIVAEKTVQNILDNVIIYPNPSSSQFFLSGLPKENGAVNLYSSIGVLLNTIHFNGTNNGIMATPDLPSGIYFIEVKIENTSFVKKGIIQK